MPSVEQQSLPPGECLSVPGVTPGTSAGARFQKQLLQVCFINSPPRVVLLHFRSEPSRAGSPCPAHVVLLQLRYKGRVTFALGRLVLLFCLGFWWFVVFCLFGFFHNSINN